MSLQDINPNNVPIVTSRSVAQTAVRLEHQNAFLLPFFLIFKKLTKPSGLGKVAKDVPSYLKISFFLCAWNSLWLWELRQWGMEQSSERVLQVGSFQSWNLLFIRSINTWNYIFISFLGAGLNCYHHFTHAFCNLTVSFSFSLLSLWPPCFHPFASQEIKGPKCCSLNFLHYPQKVSQCNYNANKKLLILRKDKAFNLVPPSRNERYSLFLSMKLPSLFWITNFVQAA